MPAAGCQESIFAARNKEVKKGDYIKWPIWIPWISTIILLALRAGGYSKIDFFYLTTYGLSIGNIQGLITYFIVLFILIGIPAFIFGKRSFCHHICWMSPFMILGRKAGNLINGSSLRLQATPENCKNCSTCSKNCPMSLPVEEMVQVGDLENTECILCGTCVDGCREEAISIHWGNRPT